MSSKIPVNSTILATCKHWESRYNISQNLLPWPQIPQGVYPGEKIRIDINFEYVDQ